MEQIRTQLHEAKVCEAYYSRQRICTIDKEVEIKSIEKKINREKARGMKYTLLKRVLRRFKRVFLFVVNTWMIVLMTK